MCNQDVAPKFAFSPSPKLSSYIVTNKTNNDNHINYNCNLMEILKKYPSFEQLGGSHKSNHKLQIHNIDYNNVITAENSNFITNNVNSISNNKNASKIHQNTSIYASTTTQILTTISTKKMPLFFPFSLKKAITKISSKSYTSTSTALFATNYLLTPSTTQDNSCHKLLFTTYFKPSLEMPIDVLTLSSKHLPKKYKFLMHLIIVFILLIMQIGYATADQGNCV